jgi:hypothetical protein
VASLAVAGSRKATHFRDAAEQIIAVTRGALPPGTPVRGGVRREEVVRVPGVRIERNAILFRATDREYR